MPSSGKPSSNGGKNFKGCMESIKYNALNITDLARRRKMNYNNVVSWDVNILAQSAYSIMDNALFIKQDILAQQIDLKV